MLKKIQNTIITISFLIFIFLITKFYFSNENIKFTNKSRSSYVTTLDNASFDLPLLENDTDNIIVYKDDLTIFKKKRKKRFWEKLISN